MTTHTLSEELKSEVSRSVRRFFAPLTALSALLTIFGDKRAEPKRSEEPARDRDVASRDQSSEMTSTAVPPPVASATPEPAAIAPEATMLFAVEDEPIRGNMKVAQVNKAALSLRRMLKRQARLAEKRKEEAEAD